MIIHPGINYAKSLPGVKDGGQEEEGIIEER
jgi:hypothetical protein